MQSTLHMLFMFNILSYDFVVKKEQKKKNNSDSKFLYVPWYALGQRYLFFVTLII